MKKRNPNSRLGKSALRKRSFLSERLGVEVSSSCFAHKSCLMKQTGKSSIFAKVSCRRRAAKMTSSAGSAVKRAVTNVAVMPEWLTSIPGYLRTCPWTVFGKQRETWDAGKRECSQSCVRRCPRVAGPRGTVIHCKGMVIPVGEGDGEGRGASAAVSSVHVLQQLHLTPTSGWCSQVRHAGIGEKSGCV